MVSSTINWLKHVGLNMKLAALLTGVVLCLALPTAAHAVIYNFDFSSPQGTLGSSQVYNSSPAGISITAYGYNFNPGSPSTPGTLTNLYGKLDGGDENGLGIASGTSDHEIQPTNFVQLDLANLFAQNPESLSMSIGSVQAGEGWKLYGSNTQGLIGTLFQSGSLDAPATFDVNAAVNAYRYLAVTASGGDVLVSTLGAVVVPEPTTMLLLGSGLMMAAARKRRINVKA